MFKKLIKMPNNNTIIFTIQPVGLANGEFRTKYRIYIYMINSRK